MTQRSRMWDHPDLVEADLSARQARTAEQVRRIDQLRAERDALLARLEFVARRAEFDMLPDEITEEVADAIRFAKTGRQIFEAKDNLRLRSRARIEQLFP